MTEHHALLSLAVTLLGALVVSTWRFSSLATKLLSAVQRLEDKEREQDSRLKALDDIPSMVVKIGHLEKNHSMIPALATELSSLKVAFSAYREFSKEMRAARGSRPDSEE